MRYFSLEEPKPPPLKTEAVKKLNLGNGLKKFSIRGPTSDYSHLGIHFVSPHKPTKTLANRFFHSFDFSKGGRVWFFPPLSSTQLTRQHPRSYSFEMRFYYPRHPTFGVASVSLGLYGTAW